MKNKRGDVMMRLNNRGFTLVEVLAVIVILSILMAIMVPNVGKILEKNKENNYADLEKSIISAAKIDVSDNRYNIFVNATECDTNNEIDAVINIKGKNGASDVMYAGKLPVKILVDAGNLKTNADGEIVNPIDKKKMLQLDVDDSGTYQSYVVVKYLCDKKDYSYSLKENNASTLVWK